jgi:hypothetical protein
LRQFEIDLAKITPGSLSYGDLIDIADATGIEPDEMQELVAGKGRGADRLRLLCGFAWIVGRRDEPALTYADVLAGQVQVTGLQDRPRPARKRAVRP